MKLISKALIYEVHGYHVSTNSDLTEGRGGTIPIGVFEDHAEAVAAAEGKGVMGTPAYVDRSRALQILIPIGSDGTEGQITVLHQNVPYYFKGRYDKMQQENARKKALSKLTKEERTLLGLE